MSLTSSSVIEFTSIPVGLAVCAGVTHRAIRSPVRPIRSTVSSASRHSPNECSGVTHVPASANKLTAPATALIKLQDCASYDEAARFGYIGTAYSGLRKAKVGPGSAVPVNGATGTLGVGSVISALALGATKVLGAGRNQELLDSIKAIAPDRIETLALADGPLEVWAKEQTGGRGVDVAIDCLGPRAPSTTFGEGLRSIRRGGYLVDTGGVTGDVAISLSYMMVCNMTLIASLWFTTEEGKQLAAHAANGRLNLSVFDHHAFPLSNINDALAQLEKRRGGFSNYVINP